MKSRNILAAGAGAIALVGILGLTTGGFPSAPIFQSLGVNSTVGRTCAGGLDTATTCLNNSTAGHTAWVAAVRPNAAAGNQLGLIVASATGNSTDILFRVDTATNTFQIKGDGSTVGFAAAPLFCTTTCSAAALTPGQSAIIVKPADTSRASNAVLTNDPDLIFTSVPIGTYEVMWATQFNSATASQGYQIGAVCTTCTDMTAHNGLGASGTNVTGVIGTFNVPQAPAIAYNGVPTGEMWDLVYPGYVKVTGVSSIGLSWAQNTSNATPTILRANSYYKLTRLN